MAQSVYPAPSSSSLPYIGATALATAATTTKGWYSTALGAGSYVITALQGGNSWFTSYYNIPLTPTYAYSLYNNNISGQQIPSNQPTYIKLTTADTLYMTASWNWAAHTNETYTYYFPNANVQNNNDPGRWTRKNSDINKFFVVGHNGTNTYAISFPYIGPNYLPISTNSNATTNYGSMVYSGTNQYTVYGYMGNKYLVGNTGGSVYYSTDSVTWVQPTITNLSGGIKDFCYGSSINNYYVVVTNSGTINTNIASSTDGVTWTTRAGGVAQNLYSVTAGANVYVAVGENGTIITSTDTITWSARTSPQTGAQWGTVAYNNGIYLVISNSVNSNFSAAYSTNGTTWTGTNILTTKAAENVTTYLANDWRPSVAVMIPGTNINTSNPQSYLFTGGGYFYFQYGSNIYLSTDAVTWGVLNQSVQGGYNTAYHSTYGLMQFYTSTNFATWAFPSNTTYVIYNSSYPA